MWSCSRKSLKRTGKGNAYDKDRTSCLKKTGAVLLTVLVLVLMAVPAFAVALPDAPTGYVYDGANVLSSSTESYIERTGSALAEACGAEVVVATVDFTDGEDIADYAYDLFNKWGIGDKKANNGLLILLSIGAEDYYAEPGVGLTDVFTGGVLDAMLYDYLEDDFAAKEYDSGVKKVYARAVEILEDHYNVSYSTGTTNNANANTNYNYANNKTSGGILYGFQRFFSRVWRFFFVVLFVILIIALSVLRPRRRYYRRGWARRPRRLRWAVSGADPVRRAARAVPDSAARDRVDLAARVPRAVPVPVADAPAALAAAVRAAVRRAQAEAPRMAEVQAEEDEYLGFV